MHRKNLLFIIILLLTCGCHSSDQMNAADQPVKNVILMIGDGMGLAQINAARWQARQEKKSFSLDTFPVTGLVTTQSYNSLITDSAAASTALATGQKTNNGMISQDPQGRKLKTLLEATREKGMASGLVATSSVTHATPATFAAHVKHRSQQALIAEQLIEAGQPDILLGGGLAYFLPSSQKDSLRHDQKDLLAGALANGYQLVKTREQLLSASGQKILGLFANKGLEFTASEPSLAEMTQVALNQLAQNPNGFFVLIEGSQIDWAAHHNDAEEMNRQTLFFDEAIRIALKFAQQREDTLVLVTADHETGGMAITDGKLDGADLKIAWTTKHHTAVDVPIYAYGPHSAEFTGVMDNTSIAKKLAKLLLVRLD